MLAPLLTVLLTFVPDVAVDTVVLLGLFLVTAVLAPGIGFERVHVTEELQVEALLAMVQEVAERVPEGGGTPQAAVLQD